MLREIIFGKKRSRRFWEITTDPETLPENSTWYVMTEIPGLNYSYLAPNRINPEKAVKSAKV